jgi:hypothetical protein
MSWRPDKCWRLATVNSCCSRPTLTDHRSQSHVHRQQPTADERDAPSRFHPTTTAGTSTDRFGSPTAERDRCSGLRQVLTVVDRDQSSVHHQHVTAESSATLSQPLGLQQQPRQAPAPTGYDRQLLNVAGTVTYDRLSTVVDGR